MHCDLKKMIDLLVSSIISLYVVVIFKSIQMEFASNKF